MCDWPEWAGKKLTLRYLSLLYSKIILYVSMYNNDFVFKWPNSVSVFISIVGTIQIILYYTL